MTKNAKYNFYSLRENNEALYDKYDLRVTRTLWFLIGFISNFLLLIITFYLTDVFAK